MAQETLTMSLGPFSSAPSSSPSHHCPSFPSHCFLVIIPCCHPATHCEQRLTALMWGVLTWAGVGPSSQNGYNLKIQQISKKKCKEITIKNSPRAQMMMDIIWACLHKFLAFAYPAVAIFIRHHLSSHCSPIVCSFPQSYRPCKQQWCDIGCRVWAWSVKLTIRYYCYIS